MRKCSYCGDSGQVLDRDREPRPMYVCAGCGLTADEARQLRADDHKGAE